MPHHDIFKRIISNLISHFHASVLVLKPLIPALGLATMNIYSRGWVEKKARSLGHMFWFCSRLGESAMFVKCTVLKDGPGPSEVMVSVLTSGGSSEELIVSKQDIHGEFLEVGNILGIRNDGRLIEFPRESASGRWRVWVHKNETTDKIMAEAAT